MLSIILCNQSHCDNETDEQNMSIVSCLECEKEVSNTSDVCPHCGYNLKKSEKDESTEKFIYSQYELECILSFQGRHDLSLWPLLTKKRRQSFVGM